MAQRASSRTPEGQGSNIPLGWKPTPSEPIPVVRCVQIKKDGERCKQWSLRGYTKCKRHAGPGAMKDGNVAQYSKAVVEAGRLRLIDEADPAIDQLVALMQPGTAEAIRLKAATEVLDRAGIRGGFEVDVEVEVRESPAEALRKRLDELQKGADAVRKIREGSDIVDAELVEDDPEQPSLFELDEAEESDDEQ